MYQVLLYLHILLIGLYFLILLIRLFYLVTSQDEMLLLFSERTRSINLLVLALLVMTGLYLGFEYDFSEGLWFTIKLMLLGASAFIGDYAFKNFNRWAGIGLLIVLLYIIALSYTKSVFLVPHTYP